MTDSMTLKNYFEAEHERLDQLFMNFLYLKEHSLPRAKDTFLRFQNGLQQHMDHEERLLFPLFAMKTSNYGILRVLKMEHQKISNLLATLAEKLFKEDLNSQSDEYNLLVFLADHQLKEETVLYPAIDTLLSEEETSQIFESMKMLR